MTKYLLYFMVVGLCYTTSYENYFKNLWGPYEEKFGYFSEEERLETLEGIKEMFYFGYNNYMKHAYPKDELDPIHCTGRGPDYENPKCQSLCHLLETGMYDGIKLQGATPTMTYTDEILQGLSDAIKTRFMTDQRNIQNATKILNFGNWPAIGTPELQEFGQEELFMFFRHFHASICRLTPDITEDTMVNQWSLLKKIVTKKSNININDVLGDYSLTLVDTLDTLAVIGNETEFKHAVKLIIENLSFQNTTVQVFEATIRVLAGLLSSHLLILDPLQPFGDLSPPDYDNELLDLAHDLASRLISAFESTGTGIPFPRVNLHDGVPGNCINETCTAGAGTLVLEFGILSRLLGDPTFELVARRAVKRLWHYRSNVTGLIGNVINIQTGEWVGKMSGLGAGLDSFFEYMLKSYILFGEKEDLRIFNESYESIKFHMRRGRLKCNKGLGNTPLYVNVHMTSGDTANYWIDALQAAWSGVQVLHGDIEEAICSHAVYYAIWRKYGSLPERYNWYLRAPDVLFYPLRPELVESTYFLYQATKNPFYLHVGRDIFNSINEHAKAECGYGTIHDVNTKELEDRMESFFLSETCKYLYLLFDRDNYVNKHASKYLFNTEGHIFPIDQMFRDKPWSDDMESINIDDNLPVTVVDVRDNVSSTNCDSISNLQRYNLPLASHYLEQIGQAVGVDLNT